MEREELIKKWLDHNLSAEEQKAFEKLPDYNDLIKLSDASKGFKAPVFDRGNTFKTIEQKLQKKRKTSIIKPILRIAAVLLIGLSVFYFTSNSDTTFDTEIAEAKSVSLPDTSSAELNAMSTLSFNENSWNKQRQVLLNGEAFFKVAKGSKFEVLTSEGKITVLGTEFNVNQRDNFFEVTCYEGLVAVTYKSETLKLRPGQRFLVINGTIKNTFERYLQPNWLNEESTFKSIPLKYVLLELERQYAIKIDASSVDPNQIFSGSFTHKNLDLALKSITLPLDINYTKNDTIIVLKGE